MAEHPEEPIGGPQIYDEIVVVARASRLVVEAAEVTVNFLGLMRKDWNLIGNPKEYSMAYRDLVEIEIDRLSKALTVLKKLQYPSKVKEIDPLISSSK